MADQQNKLVITVVGIIAVLLIGGGWLFFSLLDNQKIEVTDTDKISVELEVLKMRRISEENLLFFNPDKNSDNLWKQLDRNLQYRNLNDSNEIIFNLRTPGNRYPFAQPAEPEVELP